MAASSRSEQIHIHSLFNLISNICIPFRVFSWVTSRLHTTKTPNWSPSCSMTSLTKVSLVDPNRVQYAIRLTHIIPAVHKAQPGWRRVIAQAVLWGIPTPAFSTALAFFDGYRSEIVPANLLQAQVSLILIFQPSSLTDRQIAQRDYFGAHTFRVLPGKENAKFKTGEDIRKCFQCIVSRHILTCSTNRRQLDWPWRQCLCQYIPCLRNQYSSAACTGTIGMFGHLVSLLFRFSAKSAHPVLLSVY